MELTYSIFLTLPNFCISFSVFKYNSKRIAFLCGFISGQSQRVFHDNHCRIHSDITVPKFHNSGPFQKFAINSINSLLCRMSQVRTFEPYLCRLHFNIIALNSAEDQDSLAFLLRIPEAQGSNLGSNSSYLDCIIP